MSVASIRTLRLLMPLSAFTSTLSQLVAILTNRWLYTMELMPNESYERFKMSPEMEYHRKYTISGLLQLCQNNPPKLEMRCSYIDYFSSEEYIPDQNDATMAIPYSMKRAVWYFMASLAILLLGEAIYLCRKVCRRQIYTLISGISFILAGLTILAGLVVYISTFKGEVSNKLRPLSEFQDALFHYRYGFSFLTLVASLVLCEVSGTLAIFLYIRQKQFQIMIDAEREEVLKKNILNLLAPDIKAAVNNGDSCNHAQPMLRIICEDENGAPVSSSNYAAVSPVDHNFLSVEFGMDPMHFCGRHGSRGRRNSRSDSYLGSSQSTESRSRKNSFTSAQDENENQPSSSVILETKSKWKSCDKVDPEPSNPQISPPASLAGRIQAEVPGPSVLHELHVPSLAQLQPFRDGPMFSTEPPVNLPIPRLSSKKTRFHFGKSESQDISLPYFLPLSSPMGVVPTSNNGGGVGDKHRKRLTKQTSLNISSKEQNRSTFV